MSHYSLRTPLILLVATLIVPSVHADDGLAAAMKKLEGTWVPVENIIDGRTTPDDILKEFQTVVTSDSYENRHKGQSDTKGGLKFVAQKGTAFHLDLHPTSGPGKDKVVKCIVEFSDNGFRLCMPAESDGERPIEFTGSAGSRQILRAYKRLAE